MSENITKSDKAPIQMNRSELLAYIENTLYPEIELLTKQRDQARKYASWLALMMVNAPAEESIPNSP